LHKRYQPSRPVTADTVLSVDAAPDGERWVAVRAHCRSGWCIDVAHSPAGHQRFAPLQPTSVPAASAPVCNGVGCGAAQVAFATPKDGYLFDPGLYTTIDGGQRWTQVLGGTVNTLVAQRTQVLRGVFGHEGCPGPCHEQIQTSAPGSSIWTNRSVTTGLDPATGLSLTSSGTGIVYVLEPANLAAGVSTHSMLFRGSNATRTWSLIPDPCPARLEVEALAAAGRRLAVLCRGHNAHSDVAVSNDAGSTFGRSPPVPIVDAGLIALGGSETYLATGPLGGEGRVSYAVARHRDGTRKWVRVLAGYEHLNSSITDDTVLTANPEGQVDFVPDPTTLWQSSSGASWTSTQAADL
jgi:hypothetical protein